MQQIEEAQGRIGQAPQHVERVIAMDPDIGEVPVADVAERGGDAVDERLAADEAMVGKQVRARGEMLARAEADLEVERALVAEQSLRTDLAVSRHRDRRQQRVDQRLLRGAQLVAHRPAIEPIERGRVAGFVRGHRRWPRAQSLADNAVGTSWPAASSKPLQQKGAIDG